MCQKRGNPTDQIEGNPAVSLAWLAGVLDCDGTICAWRHQSRKTRARLAVYNTNWLLIDKARWVIHWITGRRVTVTHVNRKRPNEKPYWQIQVQRRSSVDAVLRAVAPYLVGKQRQAYLALELNETNSETVADRIKHLNRTPPTPRDETVETERHKPKG